MSKKSLINAAPELLEACKKVLPILSKHGFVDEEKMLITVISKAEGRL